MQGYNVVQEDGTSENSFVKFLTQCCKNDSMSLMSRNTKHFKARWERQEYDKETQTNILLLKEIKFSLEGSLQH